MINIIVGILLIVGVVIATIVCLIRTPENLQGYYGLMYFVIASFAVAGAVALFLTR